MVLNINFAAMQVTDDDVSIFYGSKMKKKCTLKVLKSRTPEKFVVFILKTKPGSFPIE